MKRWLVIVAAATLLAGAGAWFLFLRAPAYAAMRVTRTQEIPGTLGASIDPPPQGFDPAVSPQKAYEVAGGQAVRARATEMLAAIPPATLRSTGGDAKPAWVLVTRSLCFASNKGDLVSSSRRDPSTVTRCTDNNLWVVMVDARTGKLMASLGAYDTTGSWSPALAGA